MNKHIADENKQKHFSPDTSLISYFDEKLRLEKIYSDIQDGKRGENGKLTQEEKELERRLRVKKTRILDGIIFPSMINLTFFFECIANHKELQVLFEDDLKDLFGIKRNNPIEKNYAYVLDILIKSILKWDLNAKESSKPDIKNFRLVFYKLLLEKVFLGFKNFQHIIFKSQEMHELISNDFRRTLAWTSSFSSMIEDEYLLGLNVKEYEYLSKKLKSEELSDDMKKYEEGFLKRNKIFDEFYPESKKSESEKKKFYQSYVKSNKKRYEEYIKTLEANKPKRTFEWTPI